MYMKVCLEPFWSIECVGDEIGHLPGGIVEGPVPMTKPLCTVHRYLVSRCLQRKNGCGNLAWDTG
jgi:hypothetical protein